MKCETERKRREATAAFLVRYELRKQLANVPDDEIVIETDPEQDGIAREDCRKHLAPFNQDVCPGQVRVLSQTESLVYVLVACRWDARAWLVIPFSSYSHPATDQEISTLEPGGCGCRVLQLWNARSMGTSFLAESWVAGTLQEEALKDAVQAWRCSVGLADYSEEQLSRMGLPIRRRDDLRIAYQQESLTNFLRLDALDLEQAEEKVEEVDVRLREAMAELLRQHRPFVPSPVFNARVAMAAAPLETPVRADCPIDGFTGKVHVSYLPGTGELRLQVFDAEGNRSQALSGWVVMGTIGQLGTIGGARFACTPADGFDGVIALIDTEQKVHLLQGERED